VAVRVLVDGWELTGTGRKSGIGSYCRNLFRELGALPEIELSVLARDPSLVPPGAQARPMHRHFNERRRGLYEHESRISFDVARQRGVDVVWSPVLHGVPYSRRPYVQTLHDLIPLVLEDPDMDQLRRWWKRWARTYRRADAVVAISRYSADEAVRLIDLEPARVHVVHNGVDPQYSPRPSWAPDDPPYVLSVSEYSTRKAFPHAFAMIGQLAELGYAHRLEVAGRVQHQFVETVEQLVREAPRPDRVHMAGYVDDIAELYRGASVFVCTSRYEGFGLPIVEAMASGIPVVSYDNSSLPEVVADAGVLVPDGDVAALTKAVRAILDSPAQALELREAGLERARQFSWAASAAGYAEVFGSVARR
jgi:glycosyltransferase involved in cell wall biosynthesis